MPEAAVGDVDDVLAQILEPLVAVAPARHHARREILRDRIRDGDQPLEQFAPLLGLDVERDAQLLDVVVVERPAQLRTAPVVHIGRHPAQDVPAPMVRGILNPNHLRAEGGHELGRPSPGQLPGEIADAQTPQRAAPTRSTHRSSPLSFARRPVREPLDSPTAAYARQSNAPVYAALNDDRTTRA